MTKLRYDLIPGEFLSGTARALTHGIEKHGAEWPAQEIKWSEHYNDLQVHLQSWWQGENIDPKTGIPHLALAAGRLAYLAMMENREFTSGDDRNGRFAYGNTGGHLLADTEMLAEGQEGGQEALSLVSGVKGGIATPETLDEAALAKQGEFAVERYLRLIHVDTTPAVWALRQKEGDMLPLSIRQEGPAVCRAVIAYIAVIKTGAARDSGLRAGAGPR